MKKKHKKKTSIAVSIKVYLLKHLRSDLQRKERKFMKKAVKLCSAFLLCLSMAMVSGCSGGNSGNGGEEKVLRWGQSNAKMGLDMQKSTNAGSSAISDSIVEGLYKWTEENEEVPVLAKDFPTISEDGLTYSFELKEGVKFHDGSELTSDDVKYTFERMFKPETAALSTYMFDMIEGADEMLAGKATELSGFTIQDDTHFTIKLKYPFTPFIKNLGINYAQIFPQEACEAAGENWGKGMDLIGTGPYKLESNDDNTKVVMVKNEDYHGGEVKLDRIEVNYIDDNNTKLLEYEAGNLDACDLSSVYLAQYQESEYKDEIHPYMGLGTYIVNLNLNSEKLKDVRVREAISLAINREEYVEKVLNGAGEPTSSFLNPGVPGHDDTLETYEYNVEKAKALIKEAGAEGMTLSAKVRAGDEQGMVAIQGYLKEIGVNLDVQVLDNGVWASEWTAGNLEVTMIGWFPLYADADNQMYTYFYSGNAAGKSSFFNNAEFDDLMTQARSELDESKRAELYKQADKILSRDEYATIPVYYPKNQFLAKPWVKNMKVGNLIYHFNDIDIDLDVKNSSK